MQRVRVLLCTVIRLAKFDIPGRRVPFGPLLGIFMLPAQLSLFPQFVIMAAFLGIYTFVMAWNDYV